MILHWENSDALARAQSLAICGTRMLSEHQCAETVETVTCEDCILRLLAHLHRDTAILLKTLAGRVAILQRQANG